MKISGLITVFFLTAALFLSYAFISASSDSAAEMPDDVKVVVDKSCFGCHNTDSKNEDGKEALDFKKLDDLKRVKKITTLREIAEVVEEGDMPPKRFLENYPDKALSEEDVQVLSGWAKKEASALIGN